MKLFFAFALFIILSTIAFFSAFHEIMVYRKRGRVTLVRMIRRLCTSLFCFLVGLMIYYGIKYMSDFNPAAFLTFWSLCLLFLLGMILLALWDLGETLAIYQRKQSILTFWINKHNKNLQDSLSQDSET